MPLIQLTTVIHAPVERCFDLARSIDLHADSNAHTGEKAVAGRQSGLIGKGETVTWEARHFGTRQRLTSCITECERPFLFEDRMVSGAFKSIRHRHYFQQDGTTTVMKDEFCFESPLGIVGKLFNALVLTNYMKGFLLQRNEALKEAAESERWKEYLRDGSDLVH